jgi:hypothetical protein
MGSPEIKPNQQPTPTPVPEPEKNHLLAADEVDSSKWEMPPFGIVAIVLLAIAVVIGAISWISRPKAALAGSIDDVFAVALPDDSVMVTMKLNVQNTGGKAVSIKGIKSEVVTDKPYSDFAANAEDFDRYFTGYPDLRDHSIAPLKVDTTVVPRMRERGSIIVRFPVTYDQFQQRKSLSVTLDLYDNKPVTFTK